MEPKKNLLIWSSFILVLLNPAAICVAQSSYHVSPSPSPGSLLDPDYSSEQLETDDLIAQEDAAFSPSIADPPSGYISAPAPSPKKPSAASAPSPRKPSAAPAPSPKKPSRAPAPSPRKPSAAPAPSPKRPSASSPKADLSPSSDDAPSPLPSSGDLKKICDSTSHPELCLSFRPFLNGKTDVVSLLQATINAASEQTKLAIAEAAKLMAAPDAPSQKVPILTECRDIYDDANDALKTALKALEDGDVDTFKINLSAAMTDYGTCDGMFSGQSPMAGFSQKLDPLISNCLAIATYFRMELE